MQWPPRWLRLTTPRCGLLAALQLHYHLQPLFCHAVCAEFSLSIVQYIILSNELGPVNTNGLS
ncbi:hypothetical protein, partial [Xanthomonas graminis]|uniref:hypothetical protein n=1 Tax=Xanthomonas graminis TaxID=3390026 RepID=UPI001C49E766